MTARFETQPWIEYHEGDDIPTGEIQITLRGFRDRVRYDAIYQASDLDWHTGDSPVAIVAYRLPKIEWIENPIGNTGYPTGITAETLVVVAFGNINRPSGERGFPAGQWNWRRVPENAHGPGVITHYKIHTQTTTQKPEYLEYKNTLEQSRKDIHYGYHTITHKYEFGDKNELSFNMYQYPACCGLSILAGFFCSEKLQKQTIKETLQNFLSREGGKFQPNIQLVAVNRAIFEENEETDIDEFTGFKEQYEFNTFIEVLKDEFNAELINTFTNKNSSNQCNIFQFKNPAPRWNRNDN